MASLRGEMLKLAAARIVQANMKLAEMDKEALDPFRSLYYMALQNAKSTPGLRSILKQLGLTFGSPAGLVSRYAKSKSPAKLKQLADLAKRSPATRAAGETFEGQVYRTGIKAYNRARNPGRVKSLKDMAAKNREAIWDVGAYQRQLLAGGYNKAMNNLVEMIRSSTGPARQKAIALLKSLMAKASAESKPWSGSVLR